MGGEERRQSLVSRLIFNRNNATLSGFRDRTSVRDLLEGSST